MKKHFKKIVFSMGMLVVAGMVYFSANAQTPGPEHCEILCNPSTYYDCTITNMVTGESYRCYAHKMNGTQDPPPGN